MDMRYGMGAQPPMNRGGVSRPPAGGGQYGGDPSQAFGNMATKPMQMGGGFGMPGSPMQKPQPSGGMIMPQMPSMPSSAPPGQFDSMMGAMRGNPAGGPQMPPDMSSLQGQMQNMRGNPAGGYQPNARDVAQRMFASRMLGGQRAQPPGQSLPMQPGPTLY